MKKNQILDGKKLALLLEAKILKVTKLLPTSPKLTIFLTTTNYSSKKYVAIKEKKAKLLNCLVELIFLPDCQEQEFFSLLKEKNNDASVDGILVQFPLAKTLNEGKVLKNIAFEKDVDAVTPLNLGLSFQNNNNFFNPVVNGIKLLVNFYKLSLTSKKCVLIGCSNIVGKPLISWLVNQNATLTICNKFTKNLTNIIESADIIVTAVGKSNFILADFVKKDCIIFDIGINSYNDTTVGDVKVTDELWKKVKYLTPVPGGIGPLTVIFLFYNLLFLYLKKHNLWNKYEKILHLT